MEQKSTRPSANRWRRRLLGVAGLLVGLVIVVIVAAGMSWFLSGGSLLADANDQAARVVSEERSQQAGAGWPELGLTVYAEGLDDPVHVTNAGDGSGRLFVVEQAGRIQILRDGAKLPEPFLDIAVLNRVACCGERGLLSVAFPPDYTNKNYFYVYYTRQSDGVVIVARYRTTDNPDIADPASEEVLLTIAQPESNHNGGQLAFGPDGYLYIGVGDGGGAGDPDNYAQTTSSLLGKILRIDVEAPTTSPDLPYLIPADNPFVDNADFRPEIWDYGVRNPWRFSFDAITGDLYIGDVGQNAFEEINYQPAESPGGRNYGWRCKEGTSDFNTTDCEGLALTPPVVEYDHGQGDRSVTGGIVYRGTTYPSMQGIYFYGDYITGRIWGLRQMNDGWQNRLLLDRRASPLGGILISSFGVDEAGNLYLAEYGDGRVLQLIDQTQASGSERLFVPYVAYTN